MFGRICYILPLTPCLKESVCRPRARIYSPNFHEKCFNGYCTTFHRYPIFSKRYSVLCKVYTGYCGTSEIEHGLCACTVDNPLAKARGLSLRTGAQPMLYLPLNLNDTYRFILKSFVLDAIIFPSLISPTFCEQYI